VTGPTRWGLRQADRLSGLVDQCRTGVAHAQAFIGLEMRDMARKLLRQPEIVGIEQRDVAPA
jgi:hypothetical protein